MFVWVGEGLSKDGCAGGARVGSLRVPFYVLMIRGVRIKTADASVMHGNLQPNRTNIGLILIN